MIDTVEIFNKIFLNTANRRRKMIEVLFNNQKTSLMQEFLDFLKHKYAYVAIGQFKSGRFAEAQRLYEKAVSTYTKGFQGAYLLQKPGTDEGIAIIIWEKIDDMQDNQTEAYKAILEEMSHLFATKPDTSFYEVCSKIGFEQ